MKFTLAGVSVKSTTDLNTAIDRTRWAIWDRLTEAEKRELVKRFFRKVIQPPAEVVKSPHRLFYDLLRPKVEDKTQGFSEWDPFQVELDRTALAVVQKVNIAKELGAKVENLYQFLDQWVWGI